MGVDIKFKAFFFFNSMLYVRMDTERKDKEFVVTFTHSLITSTGLRFPSIPSTAVLDLRNRNLLNMLIYFRQSTARNENK